MNLGSPGVRGSQLQGLSTTGSLNRAFYVGNRGSGAQSPRVSNPGSCLSCAHPVPFQARLKAPAQFAKQPLGRAPTFKV